MESKLKIVQYQHLPLAIGIKSFRGDCGQQHRRVPVREKSLLVELSLQRVAGGGLAVRVTQPAGKGPIPLSGKVGALFRPSREGPRPPPCATRAEEVSHCSLNTRGQRTFMPRTELLGAPFPPGCDNGAAFPANRAHRAAHLQM